MEDRLNIIHRQWQILKSLNIYPSFKTKEKILEELEIEGYKVSEKTLLRDLQVLSLYFGINQELRLREVRNKFFLCI